ncbi:MAG: PhnD/SsuA/transferrin family substrate-binding protein [Gammaproteobacteria bacterium]|nr:PhnD/SsuA/transferrin family substrate-binding protein [Gammaproteobacteria bacterium]
MNMLRRRCVLFCLASGLIGPFDDPAANAQSPMEKREFVLGVYSYILPTQVFKKMNPLRIALQEGLARKGIYTHIRLKISPTYRRAIDNLVTGKTDFVRFGPVSYVLAKRKNPDIELLAMESNNGSKRFNGVLSVPIVSAIHTVQDLKGKTVAFGNRQSTTGRYLAQAALVKEGIKSTDLAGHVYLNRHDKVAFAVATGSYDAGATNENTFIKYMISKGLRKILEFPCVTKPWVARSGLDRDILDTLREVLLELQDKAALKAIKRTGFLPTQDNDYDLIREGLRLAWRFDERKLSVALHPSENTRALYNRIKPLLDTLQQQLAEDNHNIRFKIRIHPSYADAIDALATGESDLGRIGPASYVLARERNPDLQLLALEDDERSEVWGVFVVPSDSPVKTLADLKGRSVAFGNRHSSTSRYLAQAELVAAGLSARDLQRFSYLDRHDKVVYAVAAGNYEVGVLRDKVLAWYGKGKDLKVISQFAGMDKPWVARPGLDSNLFKVIRDALLNLPRAVLEKHLDRTRFVIAQDSDFDSIRSSMRKARSFNKRQ